MAVSAKNFWLAGGFDERLFLYHEEEVLARRLDNIGIRTVLAPSAVIIHLGALSTSQVRDFAARQYYRSAALTMMLHYPRRIAIPTVVALWALLAMMAILTPLRTRVRYRAEKDMSWYRSGAAGAAAGLFSRVVRPPATTRSRHVRSLTTESSAVV
jgi:GT2 family glycosyltransferase